MSSLTPSPKKSTTGLWLGGAAILLVALIAVIVLLLNRPSAPAAPASAVIVSAETSTPEPVVATPTAVDTPAPASTETPTSTPMPELGTSNLFVEYILDASGSMSETLSDGLPKIEVAQRVLTEHMRSFRPETNIGLRVYGHRLPYQQTDESCQDIELIAPPEKGQMERIAGWLQDFTVQGMTPLAASLAQAKEDFIYDASRINSIVMLSDGIETCGGDPCQLVEDLKVEGINFTIHVIGLDVDDPTRQQLTCIAEAGDGTYHDARSQQELDTALGAVKTDVTEGEIVVPPGENTPTPIPTVTSTPTPTLTATPSPSPVPVASAPSLPAGSVQISEKDGMAMVFVPAGDFTMGSPSGVGVAAEQPVHTVYLDAYWMDRTEVTSAMMQRFVDETGYPAAFYTISPSHPAINMNWSDAAAYCQWAGRRLPTEAEWEKAARGTDARMYPWGNQITGAELAYCDANCRLSPAGESLNDGLGLYGIAPVGSYPQGASPYGALDMAGNVSEWVADWYDASYYSRSPGQNPQGPDSGSEKVQRGGRWHPETWTQFRSSSRSNQRPEGWSGSAPALGGLGFRCAVSAGS